LYHPENDAIYSGKNVPFFPSPYIAQSASRLIHLKDLEKEFFTEISVNFCHPTPLHNLKNNIVDSALGSKTVTKYEEVSLVETR
jgi:hypothetical protein